MSHDRGCFKCGDDRPYDGCRNRDCPQLNRGYYSPEATKQRNDEWEARVRAEELKRQQAALNFWAI